jgi:hypothetical protein
MTYLAMKKIIEAGGYNKEEVLEKLDIFFAGNRITKAQYGELTALVSE